MPYQDGAHMSTLLRKTKSRKGCSRGGKTSIVFVRSDLNRHIPTMKAYKHIHTGACSLSSLAKHVPRAPPLRMQLSSYVNAKAKLNDDV